MSTQTGQCAKCRAINSYSAVNCIDCGARLPWGDATQAAKDQVAAAQAAAQQAQQTAQAAQAQQAAAQTNSPVATGKFCPKCGKVIVGTTNYCSRCGYSLNAFNDEPSFGFAFLGFLIPIVGLIVFLVMRDNSPERAHSAGKGAIAGVLVYALLGGGWFLNMPVNSGDNGLTSPMAALVNQRPDIDTLQKEIQENYNKSLAEKKADVTCTKVALVRETSNKYTGFAELSDNTKMDVTVTFGDDGNYIYKVSR